MPFHKRWKTNFVERSGLEDAERDSKDDWSTVLGRVSDFGEIIQVEGEGFNFMGGGKEDTFNLKICDVTIAGLWIIQCEN